MSQHRWMGRRGRVAALALAAGVVCSVVPGSVGATVEDARGASAERGSQSRVVLPSWRVYDNRLFVDIRMDGGYEGVDHFETELRVEGQPVVTGQVTLESGRAQEQLPEEDGVPFTWRVRAVGDGQWDWVEISSTSGGYPPSSVTDITATSHPQQDRLSLSWTPPSDTEISEYEVRVRLDVRPEDDQEIVLQTTVPRVDVRHDLGRSTGTVSVRSLSEYGWGAGGGASFVYEDQYPAPLDLRVKHLRDGYLLKWDCNRGGGLPEQWSVAMNDETVATLPGGKNSQYRVTGLPAGARHVFTIRAVDAGGVLGLPGTLRASIETPPGQMDPPTVRPGKRGGQKTVRLTWGDPDWGESPPRSFGIEATGRDYQGTKVTIRRFADADERSMDFGVGSTGPWRFVIYPRAAIGEGPKSERSARVKAR